MKIEYRSNTPNIVAFQSGVGWPWQFQHDTLFCFKVGETSNWTSNVIWNYKRVNE